MGLLSAFGLLSPRKRARRKLSQDILSTLPRERLEALARRHAGAQFIKYLDVEAFVPRYVELCQYLGLVGGRQRRILDIGCGGGLFMYCARYLGHDPIGIDVDNELQAAMASMLGMDRRIAPVAAGRPLDVEGSFDLITCIAVTFDRVETPRGRRTWGDDEWRCFIEDATHRLAPAGRLFLRLNEGSDHRAVRALGPARARGHRFLFGRD
jgi:SAM-dependent methyltransferase